MNNSRTIGRTKALQVLFSFEYHDQNDLLNIHELVDLHNEEFSMQLITEFNINKVKIDSIIISKLENWSFDRINFVDRNILRLGVLELILQTADRAVIINEYVDIAKQWGTEKSGSFVNGILDSVTINNITE